MGENALAAHNARAKAINARNKRRAKKFTENKGASPCYKADGGYCGVWLPVGIKDLPGGKCTGVTREGSTITGRYWEPALNKKSGKLFAAEVAKWEKLPGDKDFIKAFAPMLSPEDFSEDGHYFVRPTIGLLAGKTVIGVPNCKQNREAPPCPCLTRIKPSEVLALYEKQEELEEAEAK